MDVAVTPLMTGGVISTIGVGVGVGLGGGVGVGIGVGVGVGVGVGAADAVRNVKFEETANEPPLVRDLTR